MTTSHQNTNTRAFLSYEDAHKWSDSLLLYFLWRRNGTEPIFTSHLCSKYQVNYLAATIQVEPKLLAAAQVPLGFWSCRLILPHCTSRVSAAFHSSVLHSATHLVAAKVISFFHRGVKWSVGRTLRPTSLVLSKNIYMHTRHDNILLQILTVVQIYRAATGAWIWTGCSCRGVQVGSYKEGSSPNPQGVQKCVEEPVSQWGFYMYIHTWRVTSPLIDTKTFQFLFPLF